MLSIKKFCLLFFLIVGQLVVTTNCCGKDDLIGFFGAKNNQDYIKWATSVGCKRYSNFLYIPTTSNAEIGSSIHWKVNERTSMLYLAVVVRINTDDRWVGFGLSEVGGMYGSDLAIYESSKPAQIQDGYITDDRQPLIDSQTSFTCEGNTTSASDGKQNWKYVNVTSTDTFLIVEMSRALNTYDSFDRPILNDRTVKVPIQRVIVAWGSTSTMSYHGTNKVRGAIRWFSNSTSTSEGHDFHEHMMTKADGYVDFLVPNYTIPAVETSYPRFCYYYEDLGLPDSANLIGYDAIVNGEVGRKHIHHYVFTGSTVPKDKVTLCDGLDVETLWPWAPGEHGFDFPDDLSLSVGPQSSSKIVTFRLNVHYDNPGNLAGLVDNSGVRLYYSYTKRKQEAGFLLLGDPHVKLAYVPVGMGLTEHTFSCPGTCSSMALNKFNNKQPVTVVREHLHMHTNGVAIRNDLFRGESGNIVHTGKIDYWDFTQQGDAAPVQVPFQIKPGDSFKLTCFYDVKDPTATFGPATRQEMCMAFIMYYPRIKSADPWVCGFNSATNNDCLASYQRNRDVEKANIPRSFGSPKCAYNQQEEGRCPETSRCTGMVRRMQKMYSVFRASSRRGGCVSRCVSEDMIPLWRLRGYSCGSC